MNTMLSVRPSEADTNSEIVRDLVVASIDQDKGDAIRIIDLRGRSSIADYLVIASGNSNRHVVSMAEHLIEKIKAAGVVVRSEGMIQGDWVLLDGGDVIVHLFRPEIRTFYNLEKMWGVEPPPPVAG